MRSRRNDGFTLVEVLVAFAILALTLAVVFRSISTGLASEQAATSATTNVLVGRSVLERIGSEIPLEPGSAEGSAAGGGHWVLTLIPVGGDGADPAGSAVLLRVDLTVTGADGRTLRLTTLKLGSAQ